MKMARTSVLTHAAYDPMTKTGEDTSSMWGSMLLCKKNFQSHECTEQGDPSVHARVRKGFDSAPGEAAGSNVQSPEVENTRHTNGPQEATVEGEAQGLCLPVQDHGESAQEPESHPRVDSVRTLCQVT